ncbi:MAG: M14 family zinc carboxypeptidase [Thermoanaerobaculales bacterium]|nr:M14 family zinc carboxypeptidase [Thermoanaerobaculales bacterium]
MTIRLEIGDRSELEQLTRLVSIENVRGHDVWAIATPRQLEKLRAAGWSWQIVPAASLAVEPGMCSEGWVDDAERSWTCYPSYPQYEALLHKFANDDPSLCRLVDLGPTTSLIHPHRLWALIVSDNPGDEENEPEVLLTSSMHGDETTGFVLMLRLIDHLLRGYGDDPDITELVDHTEIWINPLANPDGTYFGGNDTVADAIRSYTTTGGGDSGVDPNRNFPGFVGEHHPDGNPWWLETETMMALAESQTFVLSANFHDGVEVVNYPWDTVVRRHPDDLWFQNLARDWADLAQTDSPGGYMTDFDNGITNGYDWYPVDGGRQDFMTFFHGGREVTIELSETKLPPSEELDDFWSWNRRALLDFVNHAHEGIRGIVADPRGARLAATIEVLGVDREEDGSIARTDPDVGDYHRLLLPGLYDLRIEANGYHPQEIHGIAVAEGEATVVDVVLYPSLVRRPLRRLAPNRGKTAARIR